jgi:hypothetical protein
MSIRVNRNTLPPQAGSLAQVAFVGTSCETNAVGKILFLTPEFRTVTRDKIDIDYPQYPTQVFTIGLFCNENFPKDGFHRLLIHHGFNPDEIEKVDISEGKMYIHTGTAVVSLDVKEASRFARGDAGCVRISGTRVQSYLWGMLGLEKDGALLSSGVKEHTHLLNQLLPRVLLNSGMHLWMK